MIVQLIDCVKKYLDQGTLWDLDLAARFRKVYGSQFSFYSTATAWFSRFNITVDVYNLNSLYETIDETIILEGFEASLSTFYRDHGLEILNSSKLVETRAKDKLEAALFEIKKFQNVYGTVKNLVQAIQVIHVDDPEYDSSYTHPDLPFSIFVSLGEDVSQLSNIRVAESIIHETMHLQLTFIENICPLVFPDSTRTYYSPWRDEMRPIRGVLHGIYVFSAVKDFYKRILPRINDSQIEDFVSYRIEQIGTDFSKVKSFSEDPGLTEYGAILAKNLLP